MTLVLVVPTHEHLPAYLAALKRGWSPNNTGDAEATRQAQMAGAALDPDRFLAGMSDPEGKAGDVILPDGTAVKRLPGLVRWLWDGDFCGSIGFRWQAGTEALPPHVLGHVGYAVVPWKRGRGYATTALGLILAEARGQGLRWIEITADADNLVSHRVIERNGGVFQERFRKPAAFGAGESTRWRITL